MLSRPLLSAWGYFENDPLQFCVWTNRKASCVQALLAHANCFRQYQDLFFSQGSVPAVTVAAAIHYTGVWQWCNDPAAKSLIGVPTVGLVGNHSSCLVVMQPQLNSVLTLQIVLLLQTHTFLFHHANSLKPLILRCEMHPSRSFLLNEMSGVNKALRLVVHTFNAIFFFIST